MRTSSYVIYVDLPGRSEQKLLVHGYTGAFDLVSSPVAKYLRSRETRPAPKPLYGSWASEPHRNGIAVPAVGRRHQHPPSARLPDRSQPDGRRTPG